MILDILRYAAASHCHYREPPRHGRKQGSTKGLSHGRKHEDIKGRIHLFYVLDKSCENNCILQTIISRERFEHSAARPITCKKQASPRKLCVHGGKSAHDVLLPFFWQQVAHTPK